MTTSTNEWNRLGLAVFILIVGFALLAWSIDMSVVTIFLYDISEDWKISVAALLFAIAIYLIFTVGMKKM